MECFYHKDYIAAIWIWRGHVGETVAIAAGALAVIVCYRSMLFQSLAGQRSEWDAPDQPKFVVVLRSIALGCAILYVAGTAAFFVGISHWP